MVIKLGGHNERPYEVVNEGTGEDFGSFATNKPVKLAVLLGLIKKGDAGCLLEYTDEQKKIVKQVLEANVSLKERREIFAFVCENEVRVRHLLGAPDANLLFAQSRLYVMESRLAADRFESTSSSGGASRKKWENTATRESATITMRAES